MSDLENPYACPRYPALRPVNEVRPWREGIEVVHVHRQPRAVRVNFQAPLEIELEYQANIFTPDVVRVDGNQAAQQVWPNLLLVAQIDFPLCSSRGREVVVVEARWHLLLPIIEAFRIRLSDLTVYCEGHWKPPKQLK